jgi:hypothetical protein
MQGGSENAVGTASLPRKLPLNPRRGGAGLTRRGGTLNGFWGKPLGGEGRRELEAGIGGHTYSPGIMRSPPPGSSTPPQCARGCPATSGHFHSGSEQSKISQRFGIFPSSLTHPCHPITSTPQRVGAPLLRSRGCGWADCADSPQNPARMFHSGGSCPPRFPKLTIRTRASLYSGDLSPDMPFGSLRKSSVLAKAWSRKDCVFDMGDSMMS